MKDTLFRVVHLFLLTVIAGALCAGVAWLYSLPRVSDVQAAKEDDRKGVASRSIFMVH